MLAEVLDVAGQLLCTMLIASICLFIAFGLAIMFLTNSMKYIEDTI